MFCLLWQRLSCWTQKVTCIVLSCRSVWKSLVYSFLTITFKFIWSIATNLGANNTPLDRITVLLPQSITNARHAMLWYQPHRQLWPHQYKSITHEHNFVNKWRCLIILFVYISKEKSVGPAEKKTLIFRNGVEKLVWVPGVKRVW